MKIVSAFALAVALAASFWSREVDAACRGSPAFLHAKCQMSISFPSTKCELVREEITLRMNGKNNWLDPHNGGLYNLEGVSESGIVLQGSRRTGNDLYTDLFEMTFSQQKNGDCIVEACSESQVTSVLDFSTNYCNLHNLYCSSSEGCPVVKHDLEYKENYVSCQQRDVSKCLSAKTNS